MFHMIIWHDDYLEIMRDGDEKRLQAIPLKVLSLTHKKWLMHDDILK